MLEGKMEYQTPQFVPMTDFEVQSVNGGGVPVVVFIAVALVTVAAGLFLEAGLFGFTLFVGYEYNISEKPENK